MVESLPPCLKLETMEIEMKATVTKEFAGAIDGTIYPKNWSPGDTVHGDLARAAIGMGCAEEDVPSEHSDDLRTGAEDDAPKNAKLKGAKRRG